MKPAPETQTQTTQIQITTQSKRTLLEKVVRPEVVFDAISPTRSIGYNMRGD